jgi:predicted anti-sigma-YlaC factor YlaD
VKHPSPAALLELHFDESAGAERQELAAHVRQCPSCGALLDDVGRLERALAAGPDDGPPPEGLERVFARVALVQPARARRAEWARAALPGAAALLTGWWAIRAGADRLAALGVVPGSFAGSPAGDVLSLTLSALGVVGVGALLTLALAPVLILEAQCGSLRSASFFIEGDPRSESSGRRRGDAPLREPN